MNLLITLFLLTNDVTILPKYIEQKCSNKGGDGDTITMTLTKEM